MLSPARLLRFALPPMAVSLTALAVSLTALIALGGCHGSRDHREAGGGAAGGGAKARAAPVAATPRVATAAGSLASGHAAPGVIVVLGSSTAAGTGPTNPANAWVERYRAYLETTFPQFTLTNLAVGGYTTYQIQPSGFSPPADRPKPDPAHNITMALSLHPNGIIINMPSNDTNANYSAAEQLQNFDRVMQLAEQNGAKCWVTSTQPRDFIGDSAQARQAKHHQLTGLKHALHQKYGDRALGFWHPFATPDGSINALYGAGDGTHLNDHAHAVLLQKVVAAKIPEVILAAKP